MPIERKEPLTMTVTELNSGLKKLLESRQGLQNICIVGEISNFKRNVSGHLYLSLKDEGGVLKACMFKSAAAGLLFSPKDGDSVKAYGRISVYVPGGAYQLYIESMTPEGVGDLHQQFTLLQNKLDQEGLFSPARKRPLPFCPRKIGVITSDTGAVIRDIIHVTKRRHPATEIVLYPAKVQGEGAREQIVEGIRYFNARDDIEVVIVGRGGGSIEDLWAFNEEMVARAVFASRIPIISAVGHETDVTICDLVADKRAATPSQAAEFAVPDDAELQIRIRTDRARLDRGLTKETALLKERLSRLASSAVLRHFDRTLAARKEYVDEKRAMLDHFAASCVRTKKADFKEREVRLSAISPLAVLQRGYTALYDEHRNMIRSVSAIKKGMAVEIILTDGTATATVDSVRTEKKMEN